MAVATGEEKNLKRVAIVGGGLAGALEACYLAKRGFKVDLYEARKDPRTEEFVRGRSVNLALSVRGIAALKGVNAEKPMLELGIPMNSRLIHSHSGQTTAIPYGKQGQYLLSVERSKMNQHLLTVAESFPGVKLYFSHKLKAINIQSNHLTFVSGDGQVSEVDADVIVGTDGAYSAVRREMMKRPRFDYKQEYISHGYKELCLPATKDGQYAMAVNHLHIWPRQTFMLIALPNQDKSFTCTLFCPFSIMETLQSKNAILDFFTAEYPDFLNIMGKDKLVEEFLKNPFGPLVSIKCKPYHVEDKVIIIGDAAHAMVPFYGQGMNCAFEDCLVLDGLLDKHNNDFGAAFEEYSRTRNPDAEAICDLAMYNYIEMRSLVTSPAFLMKKKLFNFLHWLLPNTFMPLYSMVTFSQIPYHTVIERAKWQDKLVKKSLVTLVFLSGISGLIFLYKLRNHR